MNNPRPIAVTAVGSNSDRAGREISNQVFPLRGQRKNTDFMDGH